MSTSKFLNVAEGIIDAIKAERNDVTENKQSDGYIHINLDEKDKPEVKSEVKEKTSYDLSEYELCNGDSDVNIFTLRLKNACKLAKIMKYLIANKLISDKYNKVCDSIMDYVKLKHYLSEEYILLAYKIKEHCLREMIINTGCSYKEEREVIYCTCKGVWHKDCHHSAKPFSVPFHFIYFS